MVVKVHVVGGISGESICWLEAEALWTAANVKRALETQRGIKFHAQQLLLDGGILEDNVRLWTEGVRNADEYLEVSLVQASDRWAETITRLEKGQIELDDLDDELRASKAVVLAAVRFDGCSLGTAPEQFRKDKDVVLAAVANCGSALQYVSKELQGDRSVALVAVKQQGDALMYVSEALRGDREVTLCAVRSDPHSLRYAKESLRNSLNFMLEAVVGKGARSYRHASDKCKENKALLLEATKGYPDAYTFASHKLGKDRECVLAVVRRNGAVGLRFASPDLRADDEVRNAALTHHPDRDYAYYL